MKSKLLCPLTRSNLMHLHIVAKITYCVITWRSGDGMEFGNVISFHILECGICKTIIIIIIYLFIFGIWVKALAINLFQISDKCLIFGAEMNGFPYCSNSLSLSKPRQTLDTQSLYLEPFVWLILMCLHFMCGL